MNKEYFAICNGTFRNEEFTITKPILTRQKNGINEMKRIISTKGKPAITHVKVIKKYKNCSLLKIQIETGRTHQIRVHLSSIGHSLVGDTIYQKDSNQQANHCFLLLKKISFYHFRKQKDIQLEVYYPDDWKKLLN